MSIPCGPDPAHTLETLAAVQRQLDDAENRLSDVAARAVGVSEQTHWRTDAAVLFHAIAEAWRLDVASLAGEVSRAREHLGRDCARAEAQVRWWGA
jgi:hypothetical protein